MFDLLNLNYYNNQEHAYIDQATGDLKMHSPLIGCCYDVLFLII